VYEAMKQADVFRSYAITVQRKSVLLEKEMQKARGILNQQRSENARLSSEIVKAAETIAQNVNTIYGLTKQISGLKAVIQHKLPAVDGNTYTTSKPAKKQKIDEKSQFAHRLLAASQCI
jgi:plasmid replication initiation protein